MAIKLPYKRVGRDTRTNFGTATSQYITYDPRRYKNQQPGPAMLIRGHAPGYTPHELPAQLKGERTTDTLTAIGAALKLLGTIAAAGFVFWLAYKILYDGTVWEESEKRHKRYVKASKRAKRRRSAVGAR